MADALSQVYAQALFNAAKAAGRVAPVAEALGVLQQAWGADPRLSACLEHPSLERSARLALADKVVAPLGDELVRALVGVMVRKGRAKSLPGVISAFGELADAAQGIKRATVASATGLSAAQVAAVSAMLSKRLGGSFQLTASEEPALLGGLRIHFGDKVYDGSLQRRLGELEAQLMKDPAMAGQNIWDN